MIQQPIYDNVDLFAGKRSISIAFQNAGYRAVAHDWALNELDVSW